jgi:hypothetical protein
MSLDLTDIINDPDLSATPVKLFRRTRGVTDGGMANIGPMQQINIRAVIVPANGRQLQRLPEAERVSAGIAIYTSTEIMGGNNSYTGDMVQFKGQYYTVLYVDDFSINGFYTAVATLADDQGPPLGQQPL